MVKLQQVEDRRDDKPPLLAIGLDRGILTNSLITTVAPSAEYKLGVCADNRQTNRQTDNQTNIVIVEPLLIRRGELDNTTFPNTD